MPRNTAQVLQLDLKSAQRPETPEEVIRRIEDCIRNPPVGSLPFDIAPAVAEHILKVYNVGNRTKKPGKINEYADDMLNGKWADTREPIKFSDKPVLRDGQNRLMACVRAGVPFMTHIAFGMPDAAFTKMDQGKSRNSGDLLQIAGYTNTSHLAPAVRWVHLIESGRIRQRDTYSPPEILRLLEELYPDLPKWMTNAGRIYDMTGQPKGLVCALLRQFHKANPQKAAEWMEGWEKGRDAGPYKPLGLVTKRIAEIKVASQGPVQDLVRAALLVQAWNLFVAGKKGAHGDIGWTMAEEFPVVSG